VPFEAPDFAAQLRVCVHGYEGEHERSIRHAPDLFEFYRALFADERLPRELRTMVNGVLAYFVVPDDMLPEETLGPYGLLDDLFVASHAYRVLRRELPREVIASAWRADGDIDEIMSFVHSDARKAVGRGARAVLRLAGLAGGEGV